MDNGEEPDQLQGPQPWDFVGLHTKLPLSDCSSCDFQSVCSPSHKTVQESVVWTQLAQKSSSDTINYDQTTSVIRVTYYEHDHEDPSL